MKWPWKKIIEAALELLDAVSPEWPPKFCPKCDGRMKQLNGDPDVYVCDSLWPVGGCGTWLRRRGTGRQQGELPNQGDHHGPI